MRTHLLILGFLASILAGCQPAGYVNPTDSATGYAPRDPTTVYAFDSTRAGTYLDADLQPANAVTAAYVNSDAGITPMPVNGAIPALVGNRADLLDNVGFGTYPNPDYRSDVTWSSAGPFQSTLDAEITLQGEGDTVTFCRSFATTCITVADKPLGLSVNIALLTMAANVPDTEIGQIDTGVSAAIRGTGADGLSIAIADQNTVALPFIADDGTPFELAWTLKRGTTEGSLDYSVSINGSEIGSGNTASDLAASIVKTKGVALVFDAPSTSVPNGQYQNSIDYGYSLDDEAAAHFSDPFGVGVSLSPQPNLGPVPLYVYTTDDSKWKVGTDSGNADAPHVVQPEDSISGAVYASTDYSTQQYVWSTAFNGDDFAGTAFAGKVDQGGAGGGFYPSPTFCYEQILPTIEASVKAGVRQEVARRMYVAIAHGVATADAGLPDIVAGINANFVPSVFGTALTYTPVGVPHGTETSDYAGYVTIGTDYASNNVDSAITTSVAATYDVTLNESVSTTFRDQLGAIVAALGTDPGDGTLVWEHLGLDEDTQYLPLVALYVGLTTPPGSEDGLVDSGGTAHVDTWPPFDHSTCMGYDCTVAWVFQEVVLGTDDSGYNPPPPGASDPLPALAATCLWGVPAADAVAAQDALFTVDGDPSGDHPAYPAIPAQPAVPPVRETAAASMNQLVMGLYAGFIDQVFGPSVPASNFSMEMTSGDPTRASGPALTTLTISSQ